MNNRSIEDEKLELYHKGSIEVYDYCTDRGVFLSRLSIITKDYKKAIAYIRTKTINEIID